MAISSLEHIVSRLIEDGVFGIVSFLSLEADDLEKGAQFSSDLVFLNLAVNGPTGKEIVPLVVKLPFGDANVRKSRNLDAMFHNEVAMYKEILPYLGVGTNFYPQMFYGFATNGTQPEKDLLILENIKRKNYRLSKTKLFLDIDHISLAIKKIAEFHSFSFIRKNEDYETFLRMAKKLKAIDLPPNTEYEFNVINGACTERGIKPLLKDNMSVDILTTCMDLIKFPLKTREMISSPVEPFAVICHGDFCNNNILYKFDENDKPSDCIFLDYQFSMYGSPAIDIFFFLYFNTTSDLREKYWDDLLELYWATLRNFVPHHIKIPSYEDFLKHFAERAIYGYTIAAFFLPMMMENQPFYGNETEPAPIEDNIAKMTTMGGRETEQKLCEIILHLLDKDYIKPFIELCKNKNFDC